MAYKIYLGNSLTFFADKKPNSIQTCITSPPYFMQRDYGYDEQIGMAPNLALYISQLVLVFAGVHRVLRDDGVLWLNLGDSYSGSGKNSGNSVANNKQPHFNKKTPVIAGFPRKSLLGVPWRVAFALQEFGWILRTEIVWHRPAAIPENVTDRPSRCNEYIFLLSKAPNYYFNNLECAKVGVNGDIVRLRNVWDVAQSRGFTSDEGQHVATFPLDLVSPMIRMSSKKNDVVLDPFCGSGTTGEASLRLGRKFIGVDGSEDYVRMAKARLEDVKNELHRK